ncbi:MAG: hypothetical protein RL512_1170, partial [Bacteroidota bacterium]
GYLTYENDPDFGGWEKCNGAD